MRTAMDTPPEGLPSWSWSALVAALGAGLGYVLSLGRSRDRGEVLTDVQAREILALRAELTSATSRIGALEIANAADRATLQAVHQMLERIDKRLERIESGARRDREG